MNNKLTHLMVARNFPEYFREEYPAFVSFIEEYYKFLDTTYSGNILSQFDLDATDEVFLEHYRNQYAINIPDFDNLKLREFIRNAKEFYVSKGTPKSLNFLFKLLFNEEIEVDYPQKYILRASDGRWEQELFFSAETIFTTSTQIPEVPFVFNFENDAGIFDIEILRYVVIDAQTVRYYFKSVRPIQVSPDQAFKHTSQTGEQFNCKIQQQPNKIVIVDGGKSWQLGQVIEFPGTYRNTIARVSKLGPAGAIAGIEILEYGYDHSANQIAIVSPFKDKPTGSGVIYAKNLVSISPFAYEHQLDIQDFTDGTSETIGGVQDADSIHGYTDSGYVLNGYIGASAFKIVLKQISVQENPYADVTIEEWTESRATLVLQYDYLCKTRGKYQNEYSRISNSAIRLQDNEYFQMFSYAFNTTRDQSEFIDALRLTHPAGTKWFSDTTKTFDHIFNPQVTADRTISIQTVYLSDSTGITSDEFSKEVIKYFDDTGQVSTSDGNTAKSAIKQYNDSVTSESNSTGDAAVYDIYVTSDYLVDTDYTTDPATVNIRSSELSQFNSTQYYMT